MNPQKRAETVLSRDGLARSRDFEHAGLSRTQIRRLLDDGSLERVGRGLYRNPKSKPTEKADLAQVARMIPEGVLCLLSALRFHKLTTQNPFEVWIAIDSKAWRPKSDHPPLRLVYLSDAALSKGVEEHMADGVRLKVFSAAKTVVDCFKFRNKVGIDVAVEALRDYRRTRPKGMDAIWRFAEAARMAKVMLPYLEAIG